MTAMLLGFVLVCAAIASGQDRSVRPDVGLTPQERQWLIDHPEIRLAAYEKYPPGQFVDEQGRHDGIAPNELTATEDRDRFAGTPWHKYVPARIERV